MQVQQTINLKYWKRSFSKLRNGKLWHVALYFYNENETELFNLR